VSLPIRVLGCSGGIGGRHLRTTALLVGKATLIDAGTGVEDLSLAELSVIDHVFLTHSHLDHICSIPFMVDSVGQMRNRPLTVYALPQTIETLRAHLFNGSIWPDFTQIPSVHRPYLKFEPIGVGLGIEISPGVTITAVPAVHVIPAVGFQIDSGHGSLVFSGDTTVNDLFWQP
jgi:ribonuclease BN (tRNA processing enzyme)